MASTTKVKFELSVDPVVPLPGFVLKRAIKGTVDTGTEGLRKRVLQVKKGKRRGDRRGPLAGVQSDRTRRHRAGPARGDGARRPGCRRGAGAPPRRPDDAGRGPRPVAPRQADRRPGRQDPARRRCWSWPPRPTCCWTASGPAPASGSASAPTTARRVNPRLIFARITGWGQDGPLAATAGHDINYLSQTGALSALGYRDRPPMPPLNLVADFGGGSMLVLLGIVAALYERERSGSGQVIDAAMVDGVSVLAQMMWTMK